MPRAARATGEELIEGGARLGLAVGEGVEERSSSKPRAGEVLLEEGVEQQRGEELGVGDDGERQAAPAQGGQGFAEGGHRPDRVDGALVFDREGFDGVGWRDRGRAGSRRSAQISRISTSGWLTPLRRARWWSARMSSRKRSTSAIGRHGEAGLDEERAHDLLATGGAGDPDVAGAGDDQGAVDVEGDTADVVEAVEGPVRGRWGSDRAGWRGSG